MDANHLLTRYVG